MKHFKYALDAMFLFTLGIGITLFGLSFYFEIPNEVKETTEKVDYAVLGGYYALFFYSIHKARNKIKYFKKHWILALFLIAPFFPVTRLIRLIKVEETLAISLNVAWHVLDELEML